MTTYSHPVYPHYFADPFVLEHLGVYYAYGTGLGAQTNGRFFEVLESPDLERWQSHGGALEPLEVGETDYWAPEVAFSEGVFYLYYSAGFGDQGQRLRVATSSWPHGPFRDSGVLLTDDEPFSIDAHPFCDLDGRWYLFYAKDFLDGERIGTALVVDALETMTKLEGRPRTVLRATHDWQRYERDRMIYGAPRDWHTLEGAFVVRRQNRYICFYSGGAWTNPSYGVSYALADHPLGPWREPEPAGPHVLQTVPGMLIGPGHNSVVRGPDGLDRIVYHAWDAQRTARRMYISPLEWRADSLTHAVPVVGHPTRLAEAGLGATEDVVSRDG